LSLQLQNARPGNDIYTFIRSLKKLIYAKQYKSVPIRCVIGTTEAKLIF